MVEQPSDVQKIEMSIDTAKSRVKMRDALLRLEKNADFKQVILDHLLTQYPVQMVKNLAAPGFQSDQEQQNLHKSIESLSYLNEFFRVIIVLGNQAEAAIQDHETELARAMVEEAIDGNDN